MFLPNITVDLYVRSGRDGFGQPITMPAVTIPAAIVKLIPNAVHSSVRADSSGSRANADEENINCILLIPANITVNQGDMIEVHGERVIIRGVQPRYAVTGQFDHQQVHCEAEGSSA